MPHLITLDVSDLTLGDSIYVRDVNFGNVEPLLPPERTLVTVIAPRGLGLPEVEEEAEIKGEEVEGEEVPEAERPAEAGEEETTEGE
jgi:large subunit ribosomal protein L25